MMSRSTRGNKCILVTGVAGSGKSTLEKIFHSKGYDTLDLDDGWTEWRHRDSGELLAYTPDEDGWHDVAEWTIKRQELKKRLDSATDTVLVFGSAAHMSRQIDLFEKIFLLEYPTVQLARERIAGRDGGYGKHPGEMKKILSYVKPYQERLKQCGAQAINTSLAIDEVVRVIEDEILTSNNKQ